MAGKPTPALDFISKPERYPAAPVCAVFGDEAFLRRQAIVTLRSTVLGGDEGEFSLRTFEGRTAQLLDVEEELSTVAMFGGGRRLAVVEGADDFVSQWRAELEDYIARPSRNGVLALELNSLPANTRLYKMIAAEGLLIDCRGPSPARLTRWLVDWAKLRHDARLSPAAAEMMSEIVGPDLGLLDQELAKLALTIEKGRTISPEFVERNVGGWRAKTAWEMLDAALDGNAEEALQQLDRLLSAGEQPIGILAQISSSLRRLAAATRLMLQAEAAKKVSGTFSAKHPSSGRSGKRFLTPFSLRGALERAGVRPFVLQKSERQLRRLGRHRGARLHGWLLQADLDLKGESTLPPRLVLERLIVRLAAPQAGEGR